MKNFIRLAAASVVLFAGVSAGVAQNDPISQRKALLKGMGDASKPIGAMMKGETPYDGAVVQKALDTYIDAAKKLPALFPESSKTGDTKALPKIWEEKAKFDAIFAKLAADSEAVKAAVKDEASFKANFGKVFGDCKACHDDYRAKAN